MHAVPSGLIFLPRGGFALALIRRGMLRTPFRRFGKISPNEAGACDTKIWKSGAYFCIAAERDFVLCAPVSQRLDGFFGDEVASGSHDICSDFVELA